MTTASGAVARRAAASPGPHTAVVGFALVVAAAGLSAVPWLRAVHAPGAGAALLVAAATPPVVVAVVSRLAGAAVTLAVDVAVVLVLAAALGGGDPGAVVHALVVEPADLLVETLPLAGGRALLVVPVLVTALTAATAAALDAWHRRSGLAQAVPLLAFVGVWALTSGAGPLRPEVPAALAGVTAASAAVRAASMRPQRADGPATGPPGARVALAVAGCGALAVVAGTAVPAVVGRLRPASLQRAVPAVAPTVLDPVGSTAARRSAAELASPAPVLRVRTDAPCDGYLATAIVAAYDGAAWSFDARFTPTGGTVPDVDPLPIAPGAVGAVGQVVDVVGRLPSGPLPAVDRPRVVHDAAVDADAVTGMVVPAGAAPSHYSVTSTAPTTSLAGLAPVDGLVEQGAGAAGVALPPGAAPNVAAVVRSLATATGQAPAATVGWLQAVSGVFARLDRRATPTTAAGAPGSGAPVAVGGTSLASVIDATTATRVATPEQFATLVAMVARSLGVPARLATGYRLPGAGGARPVAPGVATLDDRDAWTWAEVPVSGVGWVAVDVTPSTTSAVSPPPPLPASGTTATTVAPSRPQALPHPSDVGGHALAPRVPARSPTHGDVASRAAVAAEVTGAAVGAVVLGTAALVGTVAAARARRRRARRRGDARQRSIGAWREVLDALGRAGLAPARSATGAEAAAEAADAFGGEVGALVATVGACAEPALYSSAEVTDADADRAWEATGAAARHLRAALDRRERLIALVRPASGWPQYGRGVGASPSSRRSARRATPAPQVGVSR